MPSLHAYRLFISHKWKYDDDYNRVIEFLDQANNFKCANYSVPRHKAFDDLPVEDLKEELRQQIRPVEVVVILGGMYVSRSDWIQFEIDYAESLGKPILGIKPWRAKVMPKAVQDAADKIVGWNTSSIVDAIRELKR